MVEDIKVDKKVTDLASIILKIEQSIEPKFLKRPLGNLQYIFIIKNIISIFMQQKILYLVTFVLF